MTKNSWRVGGVAAAPLLLLMVAWRGGAQSGENPPVFGGPLPGLTTEQSTAFFTGRAAFAHPEDLEDGIGPVFNGTSCAECHAAGAVGGASTNRGVSLVRRIGGLVNGKYSDLAEFGGPVLQARSIKEFDPSCPINPESVPNQATYVSHRITTPLFGAGLIEAIPDATILAQVGRPDWDGVHGVANLVTNPETGEVEVGRFGWKAHASSLHVFAADAYLNEMGITSALFPTENLPQGQPIPAAWDTKADPEDQDGDTEEFTTYMRFLGAPPRRIPATRAGQVQVTNGEKLFRTTRCVACHVPELRTGANPVAALAHKPVGLYSDLLLHQMGSALADGIQQGQAKGDQFRTTPLWGISQRPFLLHDGRAQTIAEAVGFHSGEAAPSAARYFALRPSEREALNAFVRSL